MFFSYERASTKTWPTAGGTKHRLENAKLLVHENDAGLVLLGIAKHPELKSLAPKDHTPTKDSASLFLAALLSHHVFVNVDAVSHDIVKAT